MLLTLHFLVLATAPRVCRLIKLFNTEIKLPIEWVYLYLESLGLLKNQSRKDAYWEPCWDAVRLLNSVLHCNLPLSSLFIFPSLLPSHTYPSSLSFQSSSSSILLVLPIVVLIHPPCHSNPRPHPSSFSLSFQSPLGLRRIFQANTLGAAGSEWARVRVDQAVLHSGPEALGSTQMVSVLVKLYWNWDAD